MRAYAKLSLLQPLDHDVERLERLAGDAARAAPGEEPPAGEDDVGDAGRAPVGVAVADGQHAVAALPQLAHDGALAGAAGAARARGVLPREREPEPARDVLGVVRADVEALDE